MRKSDPLVEALKALCRQQGGHEPVAEKARVSADNLWQIINGIKLPSGNPRGVGPQLRGKLTAAFPHWMDGGMATVTSRVLETLGDEPNSRNEGVTEIRQFDTGGGMGNGLVLRDQPGIIQSWRVSPDWIQKNVHNFSSLRNLAIVTGFGDSMRPLFNPGDPLLVDRGVTKVEFDAIYFFRVGDEGFIKRLQRVPGNGLLAISENPSYRDWTVSNDMDFEVFARVVKVWRGEDF